jgi:uncharacterized protein involved in exopolysaccharide biosynthesis
MRRLWMVALVALLAAAAAAAAVAVSLLQPPAYEASATVGSSARKRERALRRTSPTGSWASRC